MSAAATRSKFTKQLDDIEEYLRRLTEKCASDVRAAGLAATGDKGAAEGVMSGRKNEDRLRNAIEENCLDVMLLQQPLIGEDLRFVTGAVPHRLRPHAHRRHDARHRLPRGGDPGQGGKEAHRRVHRDVRVRGRHGRAGRRRLRRIRRGGGPQRVVEEDNRVNELYDEVEGKLVELIRAGKSSAQYLPELLMVAKYFERIGDLAKRVAAWAIFRVTGEHVVAEKASQQR